MAPEPADPHKPLRDDVHVLGELLGEVLQRFEGRELFDRVEEVRAFAKSSRTSDAAFEELAERLRDVPLASAVPIARAFAHFLALANVAEQHHRIRRRRQYACDATAHPQPGSCEEAFARWRTAGLAAPLLAHAISSLRIELVLTAHPTEIARRTLLKTHRRIAETLARRDRADLTPAERQDATETLRRDIAVAWQTSETRDDPVSPLDEVRGGLAVFEETLWDALPKYMRQLDRAARAATGEALPLEATPLRFGTWIGGDRDGNPNVTAAVTRTATWMARWTAADLYLREVDALRGELSLASTSRELQEAAGGAREPYRALLRGVAARLRATRLRAAEEIRGATRTPSAVADEEPYLRAEDLAAPLRLCHRSLVETDNDIVASGRLADILRRVAVFGLVLAPLDIRQEASRHTEAVDWILRTRGVGTYSDLPEPGRVALLVGELAAQRPAASPLPPAPPPVQEVLDTFRTAAAIDPESLGAYVITMASRASDVLAVEWLQHAAGNAHPQRVVPLFETADDLAHASSALDTLFGLPWYRGRIGGHQEVMVGYSDSAKDAGRFAAAWALYRAQEQIAAACERHGVRLTLFHGRGGSIGRGGGPTYLAIQSQPPGSIRGALRVTEQGEMIEAKFGLPDIAVRTLEVYTTATLEATLTPAAAPADEWRHAMDRLFDRARAGYRGVVYEHPRFVEYFHQATPEPELRSIPIGSRPARRGSAEGVGSLRAIPWQFAWTQTRLLLASWLGVEAALAAAIEAGELPLLRRMYAEWPFFRSTIDLIEMVLAKADGRIAAEYDRRLVAPDLQPLGGDLRRRLAQAGEAVRAVSGHREPLETNAVLRRSIEVRNPYVDPINMVQIELLARLRRDGASPALVRAFGVTVNGIAAGMRNTG